MFLASNPKSNETTVIYFCYVEQSNGRKKTEQMLTVCFTYIFEKNFTNLLIHSYKINIIFQFQTFFIFKNVSKLIFSYILTADFKLDGEI